MVDCLVEPKGVWHIIHQTRRMDWNLLMPDTSPSDHGLLTTPTEAAPKRIVLIACAVLELEIEHYRQAYPQLIHVETLQQGLHNEPRRLQDAVQQAIEKIERQLAPDAIVLGYGLCSRGLEGVHAAKATLVIAKAHDCITLLLGSKERYQQYVSDHPGTYWYSPGWNKHHTPPGPQRYETLYHEYLTKFGEDEAKYLMEMEQHWFTTYTQATYVDLTVGVTEQDLAYTKDCAHWLKWNFDHQHGDATLLKDLLGGRWDSERFLVLAPGWTLQVSGDEQVIRAIPCSPSSSAP